MPEITNPFLNSQGSLGEPTSVAETAIKGDYRETLLALRDKLARSIDTSTQARDTASLSRNLQLVLKEINELPTPEKSVSDEFAEKSKARRKSKPKPKASDDE